MNFFKNVTTIEELKKEYRKLAKQHHPDLGGDTETMKVINNEYELLFAKLQKSSKNKAEQAENVHTYKDIINAFINYDDINIEIVGSWVWIDGQTYPIKDKLKSNGFKWSSSRKKWYHSGDGETKRRRGTGKDFDEIRSFYGSHKIKSNGSLKLATV